VANKEYIERLQSVIFHLHKCDSKWVESVPVQEVFKGQTIWQGVVEVFALSGTQKPRKPLPGATQRAKSTPGNGL